MLAYSDMVIAASCCETSFAVRLEVGRVDGSILVVPGDKQRSGLHPGGGKHQARKQWSWKSSETCRRGLA
jgi:hypothetical protein